MRVHYLMKHRSVPLLGTTRHRGAHIRHGTSGAHPRHRIKGRGAEMMLHGAELDAHGLENMYIDHSMIGDGVKKKKHIKPLHFKF